MQNTTITSNFNVTRNVLSPRFTYLIVLVCLIVTASTSASLVDVQPFDVTESSHYLVIATHRLNGNTDVATSNFELGANKAPVPSTDKFLDGNSTGGPTLEGAVPDLPANAAPIFQGIGNGGNIALMDPQGEFGFDNVGVYADPNVGIQVAGGPGKNKSSGSYFNDPNHYPNTFDTNTQTGNTTSGNPANKIDSPTHKGVTYNVDHSALQTELTTSRNAINALAATDTLNVSGSGGTVDWDMTIYFSGGLNVVDIVTGGNDFKIQSSNFVIDGPSDAVVIFRLPNDDNMLVDSANVLIGNGGILSERVLFYTDQSESDTHFSFSNALLGGVAFWSLGPNGGKIDISNAQGETQLIADEIVMSDVRLGRSGFGGVTMHFRSSRESDTVGISPSWTPMESSNSRMWASMRTPTSESASQDARGTISTSAATRSSTIPTCSPTRSIPTPRLGAT